MNIEQILSQLDRLTLDFFAPTDAFYEQIQSQIDYQQLIARGATSITFPLKYDDHLVVKQYRPCLARQEFAINRYNCEEMHNHIQMFLLPHAGKKLLLLANYLAEGVVGGLLNQISSFTPHFIQTHGVYFSRAANTAYTIMERGQINWESVLHTQNDVYILLFQIAHALQCGQTLLRFTDYDLHSGNIVFVRPSVNSYQYHVGTQMAYLIDPPFIVKLIDFGMSRVETDTMVINSMNDRVPYPNHGVFNPFYDFAMLLGPRLIRDDSEINKLIRGLLTRAGVSELLRVVFGLPMTGPSDLEIGPALDIYAHFYGESRPMEYPPTNYANIETILQYLASKITGWSPVPLGTVRATQPLLYIEQPRRSLANTPYRVDNGIMVESEFVGHLLYHVATIQPRVATNYRFVTRCCKLDPIEFFNERLGIAINGTFFDVASTFEAIGPYRERIQDRWFETNLLIPQLYGSYYGFVLIRDGGIEINRNAMGVGNGDMFRTGPILIWEGQPQFNENSVDEVRNVDGQQVAIFHCQQSENVDRLLPADGVFTYNCNTIRPGELSHGTNRNPRTMLITRQNGDVLFVVIEGRNPRSQGATFLEMIQLAQLLGAWNAINLDGGQSSNMAFRSPNDEERIYSLVRLPSYPVGNIISFLHQDFE